MSRFICQRSQLSGEITPPPSKSQTMRAILFALMARGESHISNILQSPDTEAMIQACRLIGAKITRNENLLIIQGVAGKPCLPDAEIDAGNSGQVLRFIGAISALVEGRSVMTGDDSIQNNRVVQPLIDGINQLGGQCCSLKENGYAPIEITGPINSGVVNIDGKDSQPVSALLIAASFLEGETTIHVNNPGEKPWVNMTLCWLEKLGIQFDNKDFCEYKIFGHANYSGFEYTVPSDFSAALYPIIAALITQSEITLNHIDMDDPQGDKKVIDTLISIGANIEYSSETHQLIVKKSPDLEGKTIDVNPFIDAITALAVLGCFVTGAMSLTNAAIARKKESDRLHTISTELTKLGASVQEFDDHLIIIPTDLTGAILNSHNDHRVALSLAVAGFGSTGKTVIENVECVKKSYPNFYEVMKNLGAKIEYEA